MNVDLSGTFWLSEAEGHECLKPQIPAGLGFTMPEQVVMPSNKMTKLINYSITSRDEILTKQIYK